MTIIAGLDTETTGLLGKGGTPGDQRIVEICVQFYNLEARKLLKTWTTRIDPQRSMTPKAAKLTGITSEELVGEKTWKEVAPSIAKIFAKCDIMVAHNGAGFDFPFIFHELMRVGIEPVDTEGFDTMVEGRWATDTGKIPTLGELCFATDVTYDTTKAHGAEYDVEVMMSALWRGIDLGYFTLPEVSK